MVTLVASSGVLVLPTNTSPAARKRAASQVSSGSVQPQALQQAHAAVERIAGGVAHRVLHEERHAAERAVGRVAARRERFGAGLLEALVDHRVERGVQCLDARDRGVDELGRRRVAARDELGLGGCVEPGVGVGHGERLSQSPVAERA